MAPELSDRDEGVSIPRVACPSQSGCRSFGEAAVQRADYQIWNLWFLGRYRSTLSSALENIGELSENVQKKGHLLTFSAVTFRCLRLPERALGVLDSLRDMIETTGIEGWQPSETGFRGWVQVMRGDPSGIVALKRGTALSRDSSEWASSNISRFSPKDISSAPTLGGAGES